MALTLTPGQAHDLVGAEVLPARIPTPRRLRADRAYDARRLRDWLAERGCEAVIPPNPTRKHPHAYDRVGGGPKYRKLGPFPVYLPEDLDAWALSRMSRAVSSTSELDALDAAKTEADE